MSVPEQQYSMELLGDKLSYLSRELKAAVDLSIKLRAQSAQSQNAVTHLWEEFLGQLFGYIKQRSKESHDNLLAGISWTRMKLF
jgi:hypothetical protein